MKYSNYTNSRKQQFLPIDFKQILKMYTHTI